MSEKLTAAQVYAKAKQDQFEKFLTASFTPAKLKGKKLFEVKVPSGMTFKCRHLDGDYAASAGKMPMAVGAAYFAQKEGGNALQKFEDMTPAEQRATIDAMSKMVRYVAVEPRLVFEVGNRTDAISVDALTIEDFNHLAEWANGGDAAQGLKTFRRKRR